MNGKIEEIEKEFLRRGKYDFEVGDVVEVHYKIKEGDRERIQVFTGTVIAKKHGGVRETFTVRRIVGGEGVERIFPLHSPRIADIKVKRKGKVRRAKLYYLRERTGKATRLKERRMAPGKEKEEEAVEVPVAEEEAVETSEERGGEEPENNEGKPEGE